MTYTELKAAIIAYTENQGFTATDLATFTKQAEQRIYNSVQIAYLRKNVTGVLSSGNKYLACPNDYLSSYSWLFILLSALLQQVLQANLQLLLQALLVLL